MLLDNIRTIDKAEICLEKYNLAIFSCGYEKRCTYVPSLVNLNCIDKAKVIGFKENANHKERTNNNIIYKDKLKLNVDICSSGDDSLVFKIIQDTLTSKHGNHIKLLIDYSSMSRIWYAGVISCLLLTPTGVTVDVDFVYSDGIFTGKYSPMVIESIKCVPGYEGKKTSTFDSLAVFGLGIDHYAPLCVYDQIEPDIVYTILPDPINEVFLKNTLSANKELLGKEQKRRTMKMPVNNLEVIYRYLSELVVNYRETHNISFIPMGPKPHTLALMLLAARFKEITCLRVSGDRSWASVEGSDNIYATRVSFK